MQAFLLKYYRVISVILVGILAIICFYVGMLIGESHKANQVILNCSDNVLSALTIPTATIASSNSVATSSQNTATVSSIEGSFAASKSGTKYYTPGCAGLDRIKPENLVWFQTEEDARLQGYTPAEC